MAVITLAERKEIQAHLMAMPADNLAMIRCNATGELYSDVRRESRVDSVMSLMERVIFSAVLAITVCSELKEQFPAADEANSRLSAIVDRLHTQASQAAADPTQELWIGAEPMVNRAALRSLLSELAHGHHHGVIYVAGGPMSGRSHSFQLIRHVARDMNIPYHRVDFALATEARTLLHLYDGLRRAYDLGVDVEPTHEGATPGDVAAKYAAHLRAHLAAAPPIEPKPWLVIDFSDDVPDPAVPEFIRMLCADRDASAFDNCVIFVLGPTSHLELMRGELPNMRVEDLTPVSPGDIRVTATALNQRGSQRLEVAALNTRVAEISAAVTTLPEDAQLPALRRALLELRREVQAP